MKNYNSKLKISAIVVGYNESKFLKNCLESILFCEEILYFDLGSIDNSIQIAKSLGATVIQHEKVPGCEWIHSKFYKTTKHDWVLIIDPDETVNDELYIELKNIFLLEKVNESIGAIEVPEVYYFKNKMLSGTPWGLNNFRIFIVNKYRFDFLPIVHLGRKIKSGFDVYRLPRNGLNFINHFWMQSYRQLFEKHLRYLTNEGSARYNRGDRTSVFEIILAPIKQFIISFLLMKGYKDGLIGLFLSFFWSWYQTTALIKLYRCQLN